MANLTPQLCIDPVTGTEVLYAPLRATRSNAFASGPLLLPSGEECPFCPGYEHETPPEVYRWPVGEQDTRWQIRVVPNRFPAVATGDGEQSALAYGKHEVLIESDLHDADWLSMSAEDLARVLTIPGQRIAAWRQHGRFTYPQVFKNVGSRAGASLAHPHLQLVGLSFVPRQLDEMHARDTAFRQREGVSYHQHLSQRYSDHVVHQDIDWITLCPPVSRVPYEMWVISKEDLPYDGGLMASLAKHLQLVLGRLKQAIGEVAHNVIWQWTTPAAEKGPWRIEILPRLTTFAGLELGAGVYINPVRPETAAERLRQSR